jgi:hypothetical protein
MRKQMTMTSRTVFEPKRGDLEALETFMGIDWTKTDDFKSTPLY